jgi:hypothetical protein
MYQFYFRVYGINYAGLRFYFCIVGSHLPAELGSHTTTAVAEPPTGWRFVLPKFRP